MPLRIKNAETEKLAREISKETGESLTDAITIALRDRLQRLRGRRHAKNLVQEVDDILHGVDALPALDDRSEDEILGYDSQGLPILPPCSPSFWQSPSGKVSSNAFAMTDPACCPHQMLWKPLLCWKLVAAKWRAVRWISLFID
jgi:antitoxin VapB